MNNENFERAIKVKARLKKLKETLESLEKVSDYTRSEDGESKIRFFSPEGRERTIDFDKSTLNTMLMVRIGVVKNDIFSLESEFDKL